MKRTGIKRAAALAMAAVLAAAGALGVHAEESRFGQPEFDLPYRAAARCCMPKTRISSCRRHLLQR